MSTTTSRVLLLEDDVLIRRFIAMALADLPLEIVPVASIAEARQRLGLRSVDLLISDLMLPDGHAMDLLRALRDDPRHAGMRIVILSAGVTAAVRAQTAGLDVFRVLDKPVPHADLIACVRQAIATGDGAPVAAAAAVGVGVGPRLSATRRERAIEDHFGGQAPLFDEFVASCVTQFPSDIDAGDRACAQGDAQALRRVAHNLKSVLQLIGSAEGHAMARRLEQAAARDDGFVPALIPDWHRLCAHIDALLGEVDA